MFATGKYDEAAGAVHAGMAMMPQDQWGTVVSNYKEFYPNNQAFTDQLRALESARDKTETDTPGVRFLLGYQYAYLGYPQQAVRELDKALAMAPQDELAKKLRDLMAARLPAGTTTPAAPTPTG